MQSCLTHLECTACGSRYPSDRLATVCPAPGCGKVLYARYDLTDAAASMTVAALARRPWHLWRYSELLPVQDLAAAPMLGEGGTPLLPTPALGRQFGLNRLTVKEEGRNPTGSFKARGLSLAVARAQELGATAIAIPSAGNAASAMAAYAARAGLPALVVMPVETPIAMQAECQAYGAQVVLVDGLINDAGALVRTDATPRGWFDVSTLKEPYRAEGKKTMGFEIAEQLGWRLPDAIIYPTGGGTGIVGMWKAFDELETIGLIGPKRPKMIVVQAEGSAPIVRAFAAGERYAEPWQSATTSAPGIRVPVAIGDYLILDAVRASGGTAVTVSEADLAEGVRLAASRQGLFVSPEAGAAVIAAGDLRASGFLDADDEVVIFATGTGLKHIDAVELAPPVVVSPQPGALAAVLTSPIAHPFD